MSLLVSMYVRQARVEMNLRHPIPIRAADRVDSSSYLRYFGDGTSSMSLHDIAVLMIAVSDNMATNILIDQVGMANVSRDHGRPRPPRNRAAAQNDPPGRKRSWQREPLYPAPGGPLEGQDSAVRPAYRGERLRRAPGHPCYPSRRADPGCRPAGGAGPVENRLDRRCQDVLGRGQISPAVPTPWRATTARLMRSLRRSAPLPSSATGTLAPGWSNRLRHPCARRSSAARPWRVI